MPCLKQTLALGAVTTTATNTPVEAEEAKEALAAEVAAVEEIAETTQMFNCCLIEK